MLTCKKENHELTDDLFVYQGPDVIFDTFDLPYEDDANASTNVASARQQALDNEEFLMVTFGANWCLDCRALYHHLRAAEVRNFTADCFDFVNVNVGKFNINVDLASDLGVDLQRDIPVAIYRRGARPRFLANLRSLFHWALGSNLIKVRTLLIIRTSDE